MQQKREAEALKKYENVSFKEDNRYMFPQEIPDFTF